MVSSPMSETMAPVCADAPVHHHKPFAPRPVDDVARANPRFVKAAGGTPPQHRPIELLPRAEGVTANVAVAMGVQLAPLTHALSAARLHGARTSRICDCAIVAPSPTESEADLLLHHQVKHIVVDEGVDKAHD